MKSRIIGFAILIGVTLCAFFVVWEIVQRAYIPAAVHAAAERGQRLPGYQILGVDLASYRMVWLVWSAAALVAYWKFSKKESKRPSVAFPIYCGFAAPLITTSALLIAPLAL